MTSFASKTKLLTFTYSAPFNSTDASTSSASIREEIIEKAFTDFLKRLAFNKQENQFFREWIKQSFLNITDFKERESAILNLRLGKIKKRLSKLADAYIEGVFDQQTYSDKRSELILEEKEIQEQIANLKVSENKTMGKIEKFLELANNAYLSYKLASEDQRRDLVKVTTSNLVAEGKNVVIKPKYPFELIEKRRKIADGRCGENRTLD